MPIRRRIFFRQKSPPEKWLNFEQIEIIAADHETADVQRLGPARHSHEREGVSGH